MPAVHKEKNCFICGSIFITKSGASKYCDDCRTRTCQECGKKFIFHPSELKHSPTIFCGLSCSSKSYYRSHPELKQKLNSNVPRGERHQFWKGGMDYRRKALEHYGAKCQICGYDKYPQLLWVHHKDFSSRKNGDQNNSLENLQVLCIRCHLEIHVEHDSLDKLTFLVRY